MEYAIALFLILVGVGLLFLGYRALRGLLDRAAEAAHEDELLDLGAVKASGEVRADGLVYLYAHHFVEAKQSGPMVARREKAYAPLTEDELDPGDWALHLLYATICELHDAGAIEFRYAQREPTFLPPFPHKRWELEVGQRSPFETSPIMSALDVAFELMRARKRQRVAQGKEEPGDLWCPLDEIIEKALKAMRQEIGFWERSGVYGDVRNYVASSLIAQGYLIEPTRETWLDKTRSKRPMPNTEEIERLAPGAESLRQRLHRHKQTHGSAFATGEAVDEEGRGPTVANVDPALATRETDFDQMPLDDCLRISIYETLISLKQLEPSGGSGI